MVDLVAALRGLLDHSEDEQGDPLVICQTTEYGQPAGPLLETGDTAVNTRSCSVAVPACAGRKMTGFTTPVPVRAVG